MNKSLHQWVVLLAASMMVVMATPVLSQTTARDGSTARKAKEQVAAKTSPKSSRKARKPTTSKAAVAPVRPS